MPKHHDDPIALASDPTTPPGVLLQLALNEYDMSFFDGVPCWPTMSPVVAAILQNPGVTADVVIVILKGWALTYCYAPLSLNPSLPAILEADGTDYILTSLQHGKMAAAVRSIMADAVGAVVNE